MIYPIICEAKMKSNKKSNLRKSFPFIFSQCFGVGLKTCFSDAYVEPLFVSFLLRLRLGSKEIIEKIEAMVLTTSKPDNEGVCKCTPVSSMEKC